jgi:hypothetical protein
MASLPPMDTTSPSPWKCFFCGDSFADRGEAALHFGGGEECAPACQIKASEGGLVRALRETEAALFDATCALHDENAEALKAWHAVSSRHEAALRSQEQTGYERGLADRAGEVERLRRIVHAYGDRVRMATSARPERQYEIDEAMRFVADNPEGAKA